MMALEDVNSKADLLPGYKLKLHWNDSEVCTVHVHLDQSNKCDQDLFFYSVSQV